MKNFVENLVNLLHHAAKTSVIQGSCETIGDTDIKKVIPADTIHCGDSNIQSYLPAVLREEPQNTKILPVIVTGNSDVILRKNRPSELWKRLSLRYSKQISRESTVDKDNVETSKSNVTGPANGCNKTPVLGRSQPSPIPNNSPLPHEDSFVKENNYTCCSETNVRDGRNALAMTDKSLGTTPACTCLPTVRQVFDISEITSNANLRRKLSRGGGNKEQITFTRKVSSDYSASDRNLLCQTPGSDCKGEPEVFNWESSSSEENNRHESVSSQDSIEDLYELRASKSQDFRNSEEISLSSPENEKTDNSAKVECDCSHLQQDKNLSNLDLCNGSDSCENLDLDRESTGESHPSALSLSEYEDKTDSSHSGNWNSKQLCTTPDEPLIIPSVSVSVEDDDCFQEKRTYASELNFSKKCYQTSQTDLNEEEDELSCSPGDDGKLTPDWEPKRKRWSFQFASLPNGKSENSLSAFFKHRKSCRSEKHVKRSESHSNFSSNRFLNLGTNNLSLLSFFSEKADKASEVADEVDKGVMTVKSGLFDVLEEDAPMSQSLPCDAIDLFATDNHYGTVSLYESLRRRNRSEGHRSRARPKNRSENKKRKLQPCPESSPYFTGGRLSSVNLNLLSGDSEVSFFFKGYYHSICFIRNN